MSNDPDQPTPPKDPSAPTDPNPAAGGPEPAPAASPGPAPADGQKPADKKLIAGILGILLGWIGVHKFYLGYQKEGIIMLIVGVVAGAFTCGIGTSVVWVIGLIEGILYLTKTDEEFVSTYVTGRKPWF